VGRPLPRLLVWLVLSVFATAAHAEQRWKYTEEKDDISGKDVRIVALVASDSKSVLVVRAERGDKATLSIVPADTIFPDKTDVESKQMAVKVTVRSRAMAEPKSGMWRMAWMDYGSASVPVGRNGVIKDVFAGDAVSVQLDATGRRYKFPTRGDGCEGLQEAVEKVMELAPEKPAPQK